MSACYACGHDHDGALEQLRCDLDTHGEEATRRMMDAFGYSADAIDLLITRAREGQP